MIIVKASDHRTTAYVSDTDTHAMKYVFKNKLGDDGRYVLDYSHDFNVEVTGGSLDDVTPIEANFRNKIANDGYKEITADEFERNYEVNF